MPLLLTRSETDSLPQCAEANDGGTKDKNKRQKTSSGAAAPAPAPATAEEAVYDLYKAT